MSVGSQFLRLLNLALAPSGYFLVAERLGARKYNKKNAPLVIHTLKTIGLDMILDSRESLDWTYELEKFDWHTIKFIRKHLSANTWFVDIGANQGLFSLIALQEEKVKVLAIEPDPYSQEKLLTNVRLNFPDSRFFSHDTRGVSDERTRAKLKINSIGNRAASSVLFDQTKYAWNSEISESAEIQIEVEPLLTILMANKVDLISILKIDIEGLEFRVLKNFFKNAPLTLHPRYIILEQNEGSSTEVGGSAVEEVIRSGYRLLDYKTPDFFFVKIEHP
jgi:FkbM family methyltransferase